MNLKRFLLAVVAVFIAHSAAGYLIHDTLLGEDYRTLDFVRVFDQFAERLPLLYFANLFFALVLCFVYTRAHDPQAGWFLQGLVFGALMAALLIPAALVAYVALPLPGVLMLKVAALNSAHIMVSSLIAAAIYRR